MRLSLSILLLSVIACGTHPDEHLGTAAARIVAGTPSDDSQNAVVAVNIAVGGLCTGTLVAPNLVVTARHCVSTLLSDAGFGCNSDGTVVSNDANAAKVGADFPTSHLTISTGTAEPPAHTKIAGDATVTAILHDEATTLCGHDIAFLVLDHDLAMPIAKIHVGAPQVGDALTLVGYGDDKTGNLPSARQQTSSQVLEIGPLDKPGGAGLTNADIVLQGGPCDGDSGGPGFAADGSLVSIDSRSGSEGSGPSGCEDEQEVETMVSAFPDLVAAAFAKSGHSPAGDDDAGDAGTTDTPDASSTDASPTTTSSSCAMTRAPQTDASLIFAAIAALAFARRRRVN